MEVSEKRVLKSHPQLLLDVIEKQAGSVQKAVLESVMNAIDAGSLDVQIKFYEEFKENEDVKTAFIEISDKGKGISSIEEIHNFFETFGMPNSEEKRYGKFHMGRGQMFAFGKNVWRTSTFEMTVDVANNGLDYELKSGLEEFNGCHIKIELYDNPIGSWSCRSVDSLKDKIKEQIEFMEVPVFFNKEQITSPPSILKWTKEDENAFYLFNKGMDLKIYNLGAYVMKIPVSVAGVTGMIVSKKQLDINFARNEILHTCPVYADIQETIKENRIKTTNKKKYKKLEDHERQAMLLDLRDGVQYYSDLKSKNIIRTSQGKYINLNKILKDGREWVFAPEGSNLADTAMEAGIALCLSESVIDEFNYTGERSKFFSWLLKTNQNDGKTYEEDSHWWKNARKVEWDEVEDRYLAYDKYENSDKSLSKGFSFDYVVLENKDLTKLEKRILRVLNGYYCWDGRTIFMGKSDLALAWTNGSSYIVLDRSFVKNNKNNVVKFFHTLCHEMAHDDKSKDSHFHGPSFYENFYDLTKKNNSPLSYMNSFRKDIQNALWAEQDEAKVAKELKAEKDKREALGL